MRIGVVCLAVMAVGALGISRVAAQIVPTSPTTVWTPIQYAPGNPTTADPGNDQQSGSSEIDLVGNATHPSLYTQFYDGGTPSLTDGQLAFRLRLAEQAWPAGFSTTALVGLDGNGDGRLDLFLGVNNFYGFVNEIGIWSAGSGSNTSPSTLSVNGTPSYSYAETTANYSWAAVNGTIDPLALTYDVDNGGGTDRFLSFVVPFADVVSAMTSLGISGFNEDATVSYIAATGLLPIWINGDLNGIDGGLSSTNSWESLGALSESYTASGILVPEPSSGTLFALAGALLLGLTTMTRSRRRS